MTRISSHFTFCSPQRILQKSVVEIDNQGYISQIFGFNNANVESYQTLFFNGILSTEIISVKKSILPMNFENVFLNYNYFYISDDIYIDEIKPTDKPLVLDFGIDSTDKINHLLSGLAHALNLFSIFEIIAACAFYPTTILGQVAELKENMQTKLILWENVDLINKSFTSSSSIRRMN